MPDVEVTTTINAPAERVWQLVGDPTRMEDFSSEVHKVTWSGGSSGPAEGARFRGSNKRGWHRWATSCTVMSHVPGKEVAWNVDFGPFAIAQWGFRIEPAGDGACTLVQSFDDRRTKVLRAGPVSVIARGVKDVNEHNRTEMTRTLAAIKEAAESAA